jgi:hypothetical protein
MELAKESWRLVKEVAINILGKVKAQAEESTI